MALRISSAEIVSSAMALSPLPCGVVSVEWVVWGRSAGQPPSGGFQAVGDAAVDDLVAHLDDETAENAGIHCDLEAHGAAVDAAEHVRQPLLLGRRERHGAGHPRHGLPAAPAGGLGEPLDGGLRTADVG